MSAITTGELLALEKLIDRIGLAEVLRQTASICHEKAEHIGNNWQDIKTAKVWTQAAQKIERAANAVETA